MIMAVGSNKSFKPNPLRSGSTLALGFTGEHMGKCYLEEQGGCCDKISREHYVSRTVLEAISPELKLTIGGLAWQQPNTLQGIGVGSLQSKILCRTHNSLLSPLDAVAGRMAETIVAADKNPLAIPEEIEFDGPTIERWFLKTVISSSEAGVIRCKPLTSKHKEILLGSTWPDGWGLYVLPPSEKTIFSQDLFWETKINPQTGDLLAARFIVAGVEFWLILGKPDHPEAFGFFRPRGLVFQNADLTRKIGFKWLTDHSDKAVIYTKVGVTGERAPHTLGWNQRSSKSDT